MRAAQLAASFASERANRAWNDYLDMVEQGEDSEAGRRQFDATLAQHAYAWAVARSARLDSEYET